MLSSVKSRILLGFGLVLAILSASAASNWVLNRDIDAHFRELTAAVDEKSRAVDMDLLTQKVRVRVNQWLRSMNPDFARQADELLRQQTALIAKADAVAVPGKVKDTLGLVDRALKAYVVSWGVVQALYAEEAKIYADGLDAPGAVIRAEMAEARDAEADQAFLAASRLMSVARDDFATAEALALRYRMSLKPEDAARVTAAVDRSLAAVQQSSSNPMPATGLDPRERISTALVAWRKAFGHAVTIAQTRAARISTWTKDEGEVMAQGAASLRADAEGTATAAQTAALAAISHSQSLLYVSTGLALLSGIILSLVLARSITAPLGRMTLALKQLAAGHRDVEVPETARHDEIGQMAQAAQVFKDNALRTRMLEEDQARERQLAANARDRRDAEQAAEAEAMVIAVKALGEGLERLAAGDVTYRQQTVLAPGYEKLRTNLNSAMGQLQTLVSSIIANVSVLRTGTGEITQAADDLSRRTEQQAASLEQTAAALDEITATVQKTAEGAGQVRAVVSRTQADAEHSGEIVRQAVTAMSGIEESSRQISQIIGVIDEIAFQTNLLALNAGVEAARAGDAGRGFAVVASEVRSLAQRSAEAAKEIKALIQNSARQVDSGVRLVGETGQALGRIVVQVGEINVAVAGIASSAQEQATGLHEVNTAINQMDQVTQQNAAMVEQSTAASHALAQETDALVRLTSRFQVGHDMDDAAPSIGGQHAQRAATPPPPSVRRRALVR